jgi:hypothetical protein
MAKELPYFQFEPAEYLTKDISFCSISAQGLFINICSYYWQRNCQLTEKQLLKRLNHEEELKELIDEEIIVSIDGNIIISFLDKQKEKAIENSRKNTVNGKKGGRPKTQKKPKENPKETQTKGIREDKIKEEEIIQNNSVSKFTPDKFLKWFNEARSKNLEKPSNINYLSEFSKLHLEILANKYKGDDFSKAFHNICNDKWANESNNIMPKHFLNPEQFTKYLDMDVKPLITKKQKINRGWAI